LRDSTHDFSLAGNLTGTGIFVLLSLDNPISHLVSLFVLSQKMDLRVVVLEKTGIAAKERREKKVGQNLGAPMTTATPNRYFRRI
jgi:hypothetical protein